MAKVSFTKQLWRLSLQLGTVTWHFATIVCRLSSPSAEWSGKQCANRKELGTLARFSPAELKRHEKQSKEKQKLGEQQENLPLRGLSMNFSSLVLVVWSCLASIHYWRCGLLTAVRFSRIFQRFSFVDEFFSRLKISGELRLIFNRSLRFASFICRIAEIRLK